LNVHAQRVRPLASETHLAYGLAQQTPVSFEQTWPGHDPEQAPARQYGVLPPQQMALPLASKPQASCVVPGQKHPASPVSELNKQSVPGGQQVGPDRVGQVTVVPLGHDETHWPCEHNVPAAQHVALPRASTPHGARPFGQTQPAPVAEQVVPVGQHSEPFGPKHSGAPQTQPPPLMVSHVWLAPQHVVPTLLVQGGRRLLLHRHTPPAHVWPAGQALTQVPLEHFWHAVQQVALPLVTLHGGFPLAQTQAPAALAVVPAGQAHVPLALCPVRAQIPTQQW
jgi:hypothetical protein